MGDLRGGEDGEERGGEDGEGRRGHSEGRIGEGIGEGRE